jgi:hypothetical protein
LLTGHKEEPAVGLTLRLQVEKKSVLEI